MSVHPNSENLSERWHEWFEAARLRANRFEPAPAALPAAARPDAGLPRKRRRAAPRWYEQQQPIDPPVEKRLPLVFVAPVGSRQGESDSTHKRGRKTTNTRQDRE